MNVYVASSWRNLLQTNVVYQLRRLGHEVYDYREPEPGVKGFGWSEIDPDWKDWTPAQYREALKHPVAARGYGFDINALRRCDACVLVLPSGRSASWEFGYAMGMGKAGYVFMLDKCEPELMYREATILTSSLELLKAFEMGGPSGVVERGPAGPEGRGELAPKAEPPSGVGFGAKPRGRIT
jgi:hypothetical protein